MIQILVVGIPEVQSETSKKGIETQAIKFNDSTFNHRPAAACVNNIRERVGGMRTYED